MSTTKTIRPDVREAVNESLDISANAKQSFENCSTYNAVLQKTFYRTVEDVTSRIHSGARVLEIGSFSGVVSLALLKLGYHVCVSDIPVCTGGYCNDLDVSKIRN